MQNQLCAFTGEASSNSRTNPAGCAGDQDDLARKLGVQSRFATSGCLETASVGFWIAACLASDLPPSTSSMVLSVNFIGWSIQAILPLVSTMKALGMPLRPAAAIQVSAIFPLESPFLSSRATR